MEYRETIILKDGRSCVIRNGTGADAAGVLRNFVLNHGQTDYLTTYPDEVTFTVEQEANYLQSKAISPNEAELVAEVDGQIVGQAGIEALGRGDKVKHRADFGICIDQAYWSLGMGRALTRACIRLARQAGYLRLELQAVAENERALALYESEGFREFGRNPRGFRSRLTGWQTLVLMGLDLSDAPDTDASPREMDDQANERIAAAIAYVRELFAGDFGGHDAAHTLRVYRNALHIADSEPGCDRELVALAALLHDADDHKLFRTEHNANARFFLAGQGMDPERVEAVCEAINSVSFSRNRGRRPATREGRIVQDGDRLDAIGAVGIARTFAYGGEHGRSLDASIHHFHEKLLLLKDELNTGAARQMAASRHALMEQFLAAFREETAL